MTGSVIMEARRLRKEFGGLVAVDDVDLSIHANTFHAIIGPNGAGKTTLFNLLSGKIEPTSGQVLFMERDITRIPVHRRAHLGIGRSFQITNIFPNLTALENIRLACQALGRDNSRFLNHYQHFAQYEEHARQVVEQVGLTLRSQMQARTLPHGDQRRLEIGMILAQNPQVLLLDEPTSGMAGEQVPELLALIREIQAAEQKTVVLIEHNMSVVMSFSNTITVMHQGRVLAEGTPAEIERDSTVQNAYLGGMAWRRMNG